MVGFSSLLHERSTLVVPFGGHLPQDGAAEWHWDLHLDRLQGFWGLSILLLLQLDFTLLCFLVVLSRDVAELIPWGEYMEGTGNLILIQFALLPYLSSDLSQG